MTYVILVRNDNHWRYKNINGLEKFKDYSKKFYKNYDNAFKDFKKIDNMLKKSPWKNMGLRDLSLIKK